MEFQTVNHRKAPTVRNALAIAIFILIAFTLVLIGCSVKPLTPPRSEVIEKAQENGIDLPTVEEDREAFFQVEKDNQRRLLALIRRRSSQGMVDSSYRIGPQDEIEISVFDVPELNVNARVRESGFISLPLIGAVQAKGLTDAELVDELTKRLASVVRRPQVSVFITSFGSQKVAVVGAVEKPGNYALKKGSNSIVELLGEAGGLKERAGSYLNLVPAELTGMAGAKDVESRARLALEASIDPIKRKTGIEIALDNVLGTVGGIPIEVPIRGGDMIVVPEAGKVTVEGEIQKPGSYELGRQMTMLGALGASGGVTYGAKVDEVEIIREVSLEQKARLIVSLLDVVSGEQKDIRLRNGDIVRVPSDSGRRMAQDTFLAIGSVINLGVGGQVNVVP